MANNIPIENKLLAQGKNSGDKAKLNSAGSTSKAISNNTFSMEKVADLPTSFNLNGALDKAYKKVVVYMNDMLESKDLEIQMSAEKNTDIGYVTDKGTGEKVSSYEAHEMLKLYSHNNQLKGVIVDGKI